MSWIAVRQAIDGTVFGPLTEEDNREEASQAACGHQSSFQEAAWAVSIIPRMKSMNATTSAFR